MAAKNWSLGLLKTKCEDCSPQTSVHLLYTVYVWIEILFILIQKWITVNIEGKKALCFEIITHVCPQILSFTSQALPHIPKKARVSQFRIWNKLCKYLLTDSLFFVFSLEEPRTKLELATLLWVCECVRACFPSSVIGETNRSDVPFYPLTFFFLLWLLPPLSAPLEQTRMINIDLRKHGRGIVLAGGCQVEMCVLACVMCSCSMHVCVCVCACALGQR